MASNTTTHRSRLRLQSLTHVLRFGDLAGILLILVPAVALTSANIYFGYDDAYITYRYAYNFASGNGFVYNVGERFLGTTAPLYGLLLGLLGLPQPAAIPIISNVLSGSALAVTGVALFLYGRHHGHRFCGLLAGLFFVLNPLLASTFGGEMLFQTALIAWGFLLYTQGRTLPAAALLAIALLVRPDAVVAAAGIGLHFVATRRRLPWRELLCMAAITLPFVVGAWLYYGSPIPETLGAKQAQISSGIWPLFVPGLVEWLRAWTMQDTSYLFPTVPAAPHAIRFIFFVVLGIPALLRYRFWLLPLAWVALYVLGYHLLGVPFYHWYVTPVVLGLMILAASGVAALAHLAALALRWAAPRLQDTYVRAALASACLLALAPGLYALYTFERIQAALQPAPAEVIYTRAGRWLAANTPPTATVSYFEIGFLGYYAQRRVLDPLGLVNSGVAEHIATGDWTWAYEHYRPEYIVHNPELFITYIGRIRGESWFQTEYREVAAITAPGYPALTIYERQR